MSQLATLQRSGANHARTSLRVHAYASSIALKPSQGGQRVRAALAQLAYSTPAQFSSFYGAKMFLPDVYVPKSGCGAEDPRPHA